MDKIKNILFLFFAGGNSRPDSFAPAHTGLAPGTLGNPAVDNGMANLAFACNIGRLDTWLGQKAKIRFGSLAPEPLRQFFSQPLVRRANLR